MKNIKQKEKGLQNYWFWIMLKNNLSAITSYNKLGPPKKRKVNTFTPEYIHINLSFFKIAVINK